jgi:mannose/cellobiose epimerase-like protein (N-acyl-D-glucosamine 2-epimerase family)
MVVEQWDRDWTTLDGYRGVNANMHSVEALLSAADVLGDTSLRDKAERILTRVVHDLAAGNQWRIPEHFDADWQPVLEYNVDEPAHPFRPYGATIGHWLEWARLALDLRAALATGHPTGCSATRSRCSRRPCARAGRSTVRRASSTPSTGTVTRSSGSACTGSLRGDRHGRRPHEATGDPAYAAWYETFWEHVATHFRDDERGSWRHELSPTLAPSALTWAGKPDVYHAVQATLLPRLPLSPTLATALARGLPLR